MNLIGMNQIDEGDVTKKLNILEEIEENPEIKQKNLATRLGIGVGTVNWYIKRLSKKGYLKMKRIGQWKWKYILTPKGMREKARLTKNYIEDSMDLYRQTREKARKLLEQLQDDDHSRVLISGDNDLAEVCRLTALELGLEVVDSDDPGKENHPKLQVDGRELTLITDEEE